MTYDQKQIEQLTESMDEWVSKSEDLQTTILTRKFDSKRSREFAVHGFGRRMSYLRHAIERTFEWLPPDSSDASRLVLNDITLVLHAFVMNTQGALDNLAHVWVCERKVTRKDGTRLSNGEIGLFRRYRDVRRSLRNAGIDGFADLDNWLIYFQNYRDSLAHRVPLYIPPKLLNPSAAVEFQRIEGELTLAIQQRDFDEWHRLMDQQQSLGRFEPWMVHSLEEGAVPMRFHAQMICDLATVVDWGQKIVAKL